LTIKDPLGLDIYRHSAAHLLAQAVMRLYPNTELAIGPTIEDGFYYDLATPSPLQEKDLLEIEKQMQRIIRENLAITRKKITRLEALELFKTQKFKLELINDLPEDEELTIYTQGEFVDLCRGPHLPSTGKIKAFKLLRLSGAYFRGDSKREMLQRIYGTAWSNKEELQEYLTLQEEARKRDHRKLGQSLNLFMFSEQAPGMPFYLPRGMIIRNELEKFVRELQLTAGYQEVRTPVILKQQLWEQSGHWDYYKDEMYHTQIENDNFLLKPMNCPGHMLIYSKTKRSYRELPLRLAEFGLVHRNELTGALHGLVRVRAFTQDDAHIFVRPDQIETEIAHVIDLIDKIYAPFNFPYKVELSTRPEKAMGSLSLWEQAENALQTVLEKKKITYSLNEGDGAFYGPKIDFHISDALKRTHQCATVQLDFQMPEKFNLFYTDKDNTLKQPVVIHRAIMGSIDRFIAILIEHYNGDLPLWLAPVQVRIIPISHNFNDYAEEVAKELATKSIRVEIDKRDEKMGYKIRAAELDKVPYMFVVGEKEASSKQVNVRKKHSKDSYLTTAPAICQELLEKIREKK
jgi:threonyl-tRNA synthetase